jgi:hypothetical protein
MSRRGEIGLLLMVMALLLLVSSCGSKKKLVSPVAHGVHYEWMTANLTGELTHNTQHTTYPFTGQLRMRRDSTIWLSASVMGVEAIRALVTNDSVVLVNRAERTYLMEPISHVATMCTSSLQTLLLGGGNNDTITIPWEPFTAKFHYTDIQWDIPTTFPIKINQHYERIKL